MRGFRPEWVVQRLEHKWWVVLWKRDCVFPPAFSVCPQDKKRPQSSALLTLRIIISLHSPWLAISCSLLNLIYLFQSKAADLQAVNWPCFIGANLSIWGYMYRWRWQTCTHSNIHKHARSYTLLRFEFNDLIPSWRNYQKLDIQYNSIWSSVFEETLDEYEKQQCGQLSSSSKELWKCSYASRQCTRQCPPSARPL